MATRARWWIGGLCLAATLPLLTAAAPTPPPPAAVVAPREMAYGADPLQMLDVWPIAAGRKQAPLVVFVHGGGWTRGDKRNATGTAKVAHMLAQGYAFASINYRLVPAATVEEQAADVARAVAFLIARAGALGIDPHRIVLMGHSAGAHLVALVGTDLHYLADAGVPGDAVRGAVLLDGAAYDVPRQTTEGASIMRDTYATAFGTDVARQRTLSPTLHAAAPNLPRFLILHIDRPDGTSQSQALGEALRAAGTPAEVIDVGGRGLRGHAAINRDLGNADFPGTAPVDAFLQEAFAQR